MCKTIHKRLGSVRSFLSVVIVISLAGGPGLVPAQNSTDSPFFARRNTFGILAAYSPDSSHILLGIARKRELLNTGVSYSRRLILNQIVNWQYDGELQPVALNSDPVQTITTTENYTTPFVLTVTSTLTEPTVQPCLPYSGSGTLSGGDTYTYTAACGRRWVIGESISPAGFQWNFFPRRKLQPIADGHGGYMYSTQPIPVPYAGSFNFTFDIGAGLELYRSKTRSIRAEYRYHHLSNHNTAEENPGVDNGLLQIAYCFGR